MGVAHEFISRMRKYKEKSAKLQVFTLKNDFSTAIFASPAQLLFKMLVEELQNALLCFNRAAVGHVP